MKKKPIEQLVITKYSNGKWKFSFHHGHMSATDLLYIARVINKSLAMAIVRESSKKKK